VPTKTEAKKWRRNYILDVSVELKTGLAAGLASLMSIWTLKKLQTVLATQGCLFLTTSTQEIAACRL
jgi:hypothetical protein